MKLLLLGHNGYLGSYLHRNLNVDILKGEHRKIYSNGNIYDYVINCVGKPDLEYCEKHSKESEYSNFLVIKDIKKFYPNSKIINFSSYYVYNDEGFCDENSRTTDKYNYTKHKLLGEKEVTNGVSFRIGKLFGNPGKIQNKLTDYIISERELWLDEINFNPTNVRQILRVIGYELQNIKLSGIYNLSNKGFTNHYNYGVYINKLLGANKIIHKIPKLDRNFHNYGKFLMTTEKIEKTVSLESWENDLKAYLKELNT